MNVRILHYDQPTGRVTAHVEYVDEQPPNDPLYYFCCETCGNCGQMWHGLDYAIVQALHHIVRYDHAQYHNQEDHHGPAELPEASE
jgi:hypothetical protein